MPEIATTTSTAETGTTQATTPIAPTPAIVRARCLLRTAATARSPQLVPRQAPSADTGPADRPGRRAIAESRATAVEAGNNAARLRLVAAAAVAAGASGNCCASAD